MPLENVLVYNFASGDNTYPHSGNFTIGVAGSVTINDSNGTEDALFGDLTHTGGGDVSDQLVSASSVTGINLGDTIDLRYQYTFTGSDGSSGNIHFIATNSAANYGPLFVSDTPLTPGVTYTFGTFNTDGAVNYSSLVPCFTKGTLIATSKGHIPIDLLNEGDRVLTRDNGFQPLRWIGSCTVPASGSLTPIHIAKDVLGNSRDLLVSPNHRMLITSASAELLFGEREVLVSAKHLTDMAGVTPRLGGTVTYVHILFDEHQIVASNGAYSESFFPGPVALGALQSDTRREVLDLFPDLRTGASLGFLETARMCLVQREVSVMKQIAA
ncbi:MAG: Hint domain-containing protein [Sulfitobacter sp.]